MGDSLRAMMRLAICAVVVAVCAASSRMGAAQASFQTQTSGATKTMLIEPPTPLLPQRFGAWEQVKSETDGSLAASMDGASETAMQEDGLTRFAASSYKRDGSNQIILMKAYQFGDASGAVAAYSYFRSSADRPAPQLKLGPDASIDSDRLIFRSGTTLVISDSTEALQGIDLASLVTLLPKVGGAAALDPLLPQMAAIKGIDASSVRYALGPVNYAAEGGALPVETIGFDKSAEVATAKSKSGGLLTLLFYPTPEIAAQHQRMIQSALRGAIKMRREGTLLLLATGSWPGDEAERAINGIHLRQEVTWDKPKPLEFQSEVRKTFTLLENIALFCAISALAMLVLGLFFGYGRALVRVMQGKPAASEPEFLRIDLREAGKTRLRDPEA